MLLSEGQVFGKLGVVHFAAMFAGFSTGFWSP